MTDIPGTPPTPASTGPAFAENAIEKTQEEKPKSNRGKGKTEARGLEGHYKSGAMGKDYVITLHDSKEIPPGGQLVGVNGTHFRIPPGRKVVVPAAVLEVLDNAVQATPELDHNNRVVGYFEAPRLSYTVWRDVDAA